LLVNASAPSYRAVIDSRTERPLSSDPLRRVRLRRLDDLLAELEDLNLHGATALPARLAEKLRAAGVGHPSEASITEVIDLLFRAQERYLQPMPTIRTGRRMRPAHANLRGAA